MGFSPSLPSRAGVIAAALLCAATASADAIPGPPLPVVASERAGAFCPARESAIGHGAGFAAAVVIVAIAARRREPR